MDFCYGSTETDYLKSKDKKLAMAIERIGHIERAVDEDLFSSVIYNIVGQQISMAAQTTVWNRLSSMLGEVNAETVLSAGRDALKSVGITYKKVDYILDFAAKIRDGSFNISSLWDMTDEQVIEKLSSLRGIGVWTAEMIMIFCMQRRNIVSYGDLAILRGMRMLYGHKEIDRARFERYRARYSPYGTVASFYLWAISGGAIPELSDPAARLKKRTANEKSIKKVIKKKK